MMPDPLLCDYEYRGVEYRLTPCNGAQWAWTAWLQSGKQVESKRSFPTVALAQADVGRMVDAELRHEGNGKVRR